MNFFKAKGYSEKEEQMYEQVAREMDDNKIDKGLWTKAYSDSEGDDMKTKTLYIRYRVEKLLSIKDLEIKQELKQITDKNLKEFKKITFWSFGISFLILLLISVIILQWN